MRTIARALINLALMVAALAADSALAAQKAYQHASHDGQIAMLAAPAAVAFVLACVALHLIPSRAQLKRKKPARPSGFAYAAPAKRGR
jgi:hypothetical protein